MKLYVRREISRNLRRRVNGIRIRYETWIRQWILISKQVYRLYFAETDAEEEPMEGVDQNRAKGCLWLGVRESFINLLNSCAFTIHEINPTVFAHSIRVGPRRKKMQTAEGDDGIIQFKYCVTIHTIRVFQNKPSSSPRPDALPYQPPPRAIHWVDRWPDQLMQVCLYLLCIVKMVVIHICCDHTGK